MNFSNEVKRQILDSFIEIFFRLSDKAYQKRVWIEGKGPEQDAYDDIMNEFFSECDSIIDHFKCFGLTEFQCNLLKKFRISLQLFSDRHDYPEKFIDTPEWDKITKMAKEVLEAFDQRDIGLADI